MREIVFQRVTRRRVVGMSALLAACLTASFPLAAQRRLDSADARKLMEIRESLSGVSLLLRRNDMDGARQAVDAAEAQLDELVAESSLEESHNAVRGVRTAIAHKRHALAVREARLSGRPAENSVSFVRHVAPILEAHCMRCHGENPRGKLQLNTFAGIKRGGESGPLLTKGRPDRSLLMYRLMAPDKNRMPKGGEPLAHTELAAISLWIKQGARFDGDDEDLELAELTQPQEELPPIEVALPTGDETVSFKEDIAPFLVENCLRCHQGQDPGGGLSLVDFESLLRGGDSGPAVVPGKPNESLVHQLVGGDEAMRMPLEGNVTEENYKDLGVWIWEGATYDGGDPRLSLRALVSSDSDLLAADLAALSPDEFIELRNERTADQWHTAFADAAPNTIESNDLLVYGNVAEERLETLVEWSTDHLSRLRSLFDVADDEPLWKGRLAVFVVAERDGYEQFNDAVTRQRIVPDVFGNVLVDEGYRDALIVLLDVGDEASDKSPTLRFSLTEQLTAAWLAPQANKYPEWVSLGLGPALASLDAGDRDRYVITMRNAARDALEEIDEPVDVFRDGTFVSTDQARAVGFTLIDYLWKRGRQRRLAELVALLRDEGEIGNAIRRVYRVDLEPLARSYVSSIQGRR